MRFGDGDRLEAQFPFTTQGTPAGGQTQIGEAADLDVGSSDPPRELEALLEMSLGIVEPERPQLDGAQVHQGDGLGVVAEHDLVGGLGRHRVEQRLHLLHDRAEVASPARERHPGDPERDVEAVPPLARAPRTHVSRRGRGTSPHRPACRRPAGRRQRPSPAPDQKGRAPGRRPGGRASSRPDRRARG